jgi:anti-sigma factor RsiW
VRTLPHSRPGPRHLDGVALQAVCDGEADPATRLAVARHVAGCGRCASRMREEAVLGESLGALPPAEAPDDFASRVMRRIADAPRPRIRPRFLRLVAPLLAVAATLATWRVAAPASAAVRVLGDVLRPGAAHPTEIGDLMFTFASALFGGLGRAMGGALTPPDLLPSVGALRLMPHMPLTALVGAGLIAAALLLAAGRLRPRMTRS